MLVGPLIAFAAVAATGDACRAGTLAKVYRDQDEAAPLVVLTATGERFRIYGNDFIDVRKWRSRDVLEICAQAPPPETVEIKDETRGESVVGRQHR